MKKIFFVLSILFLFNSVSYARDCKSGDIKGDAFIYSDGKQAKVIYGTDIPNPANKIIMIFNKGGWVVDQKWGNAEIIFLNNLVQFQGQN